MFGLPDWVEPLIKVGGFVLSLFGGVMVYLGHRSRKGETARVTREDYIKTLESTLTMNKATVAEKDDEIKELRRQLRRVEDDYWDLRERTRKAGGGDD